MLSGFEVLLDSLTAYVRITARILLVHCPVCGQVHNSGPKRMKTTITLTDENAAIVAQYGELTGFTQEELTNWFLADYFGMFDDEDQSFINETIGSMYFKDRKSAERVQTWLVKRLEKKGYFHDSIETQINSNPDGTFDVRLSVPALLEKGGRHQVA